MFQDVVNDSLVEVVLHVVICVCRWSSVIRHINSGSISSLVDNGWLKMRETEQYVEILSAVKTRWP